MSARWILVLVLPLLLGMRDPFQPPEDRCGMAKLPLWRYHGAIVSQGRQIGLLRDANGGWRRVQPETQLPVGWQIVLLTERELLITTGIGCVPEQWSWPREGLRNETKETFTGDRSAGTGVPGGKTLFGVADGR